MLLNPHENKDFESIIEDLHKHIELVHGFVKVNTDALAEKHITHKLKYGNFTRHYYECATASYASNIV